MFEPTKTQVEAILRDFGIALSLVSVQELERCCEKDSPGAKEVRLIVKAVLEDSSAAVIRLKNEKGVPVELLEEQCAFAERLRAGGILTPAQYRAQGAFVRQYSLGGYDVAVTVEEFVSGEVRCYDEALAGQAGRLLARCHAIAEEQELHVHGPVLFDPFAQNELFDFSDFETVGERLAEEDLPLYREIIGTCQGYWEALAPLKACPRYAVQGDISDCNLYRLSSGALGIFDFNRSGDSELFCDAVMQALFAARLMDYAEDCKEKSKDVILPAFLRGYDAVRPFTPQQKKLFPYLYGIVSAFWSSDIRWNEDSLLKCMDRNDRKGVRRWLEEIRRRLGVLPEMPL